METRPPRLCSLVRTRQRNQDTAWTGPPQGEAAPRPLSAGGSELLSGKPVFCSPWSRPSLHKTQERREPLRALHANPPSSRLTTGFTASFSRHNVFPASTEGRADAQVAPCASQGRSDSTTGKSVHTSQLSERLSGEPWTPRAPQRRFKRMRGLRRPTPEGRPSPRWDRTLTGHCRYAGSGRH